MAIFRARTSDDTATFGFWPARIATCEDPSFVEAARLLARFIAPEVTQEEILLIERCPSDEPLTGASRRDLLENYVGALAHKCCPRDGAVARVLPRFAEVVSWHLVTRALFRSLPADDAVAGALRGHTRLPPLLHLRDLRTDEPEHVRR